jgi:hypothetical protein
MDILIRRTAGKAYDQLQVTLRLNGRFNAVLAIVSNCKHGFI